MSAKRLRRWSVPVSDPDSLKLFDEIKHRFSLSGNIALYRSLRAGTPVLLGFLRPCIYLPDRDFSRAERSHILAHELCHYKRKDPWCKLILLLANSLRGQHPL